ncbi:MAG: hypothetical protein KDA93_12665 [Planctomycetaceae bacterium]|nr:hypothetical protein [Planctomycetaceae bacterium]
MAESNTSATLTSGGSGEFPCPDCGEDVREGLVRCWNCGGFLRPEVEEKFQKIQSRPQKIIYSPATADEGPADLDALMSKGSGRRAQSDGGDFELAGGALSNATPAAEIPMIQDEPEPETVAADETSTPAEETDNAGTGDGDGTDPAASDKVERESAGGDEVAHSIATGGDALLELAAQEEQERGKRQADRGMSIEGVKAIRDGFLIEAPKGCRIQVRDERTGELRRFTFKASTRVRISLLDKLAAIAKAKQEAAESGEADAGPKHLSAGIYQRWMSAVNRHTLNPEKLKLKADSMAGEFVPVEVGFADESMLVATLPVAKKAGLFGSGKSKGDADEVDPTTKLLEHFRAGKAVGDAPVGEKTEYTADQVAELRIVQPAASLTESLFAGIPVFGTGRIAVQLPLIEAGDQAQYLSFALTKFREFAEILGSMYSMGEFGHNMDIPLTDTFNEHKCHFSDVKIRALEGLAYYEADPEIEVVLAGWLCTACGIAVSEDARAKEKLGGKAGKSIAKTKCPKCEEKMGSNPLYTLASAKQSANISGEEPEDETPSEA